VRWSEIDQPPTGINPSTCYHCGVDTNGAICGAMAARYLPMPYSIPDMPLCEKHWVQYENLNLDDLFSSITDLFSKKEEEDGFGEH
jgi:hypothetical protein